MGIQLIPKGTIESLFLFRRFNMSNAAQTTTQNAYFDCITKAFGYVNDPRLVTPKKGSPYLALRFTALIGSKTEPVKLKYEVNVTGLEAKELTKLLIEKQDAAKPARLVIQASVEIGDAQPDSYSDKNGNPVLIMRGRLLKFAYLKIGDDILTPVATPAVEIAAPVVAEVAPVQKTVQATPVNQTSTEPDDDYYDALEPEYYDADA
jgi:hypothetical protein